MKILAEVCRILRPAGILVLDLPDREHVRQHYQPRSEHMADEDISVSRERTMEGDMIYCRERVTSVQHGLIRDSGYCIRLFSRRSIAALLKTAGFNEIAFAGNFMCRRAEGDYGTMTNRMIVTAVK